MNLSDSGFHMGWPREDISKNAQLHHPGTACHGERREQGFYFMARELQFRVGTLRGIPVEENLLKALRYAFKLCLTNSEARNLIPKLANINFSRMVNLLGLTDYSQVGNSQLVLSELYT